MTWNSNRLPWRTRTLWTAGHTLVNVGGTDLAASLAYYTILSFLPFIALIVLIFTAFMGQETVRSHLSNFLSIYFPSSVEFLDIAVTPLFDSRPIVGVISVLTLLWGANGLFLATSRTINRAFGSQQRPFLGMTVAQISLALGVLLLFLVTIALSQMLRIATDASAEQLAGSGLLSDMTSWFATTLLSILPLLGTFLVFLIVYRVLPNRPVPWSDATFGAFVASILFEEVKFLFFWLATTLGHQSLVYGPLTSVVIFLVWTHMAGLIFLYGACITRESMRLRPSSDPANM